MGRLARTLGVSLMALALGQAATARESIKFVDGGDLLLLEPAAPQSWPALGKEKAAPNSALNPSPDGKIIRIQPAPGGDTVSVGVDIKLDESDRIELREAGRVSFRSEMGLTDDFADAAMAGAFAAPARTAMTPQGFDSRALFARAASVNLDRKLASAMVRDPRGAVSRYAGLSIGYATGFSADDPLGLDPSERGFEVHLNSAMMSAAPAPDAFALAVPGFAYADKAYNVGVNVGYRGFMLAGSFLRGGADGEAGYRSYDVGLSYDFGSWVTSIAVGGYFADRNPMSLLAGLDVDQLYSVEIGAEYELRPGVTLLGRLKFFDSRTLLRDRALDGLGGSLYLGTSFGF
jgi:hypothetical protein